jgi:hypothetical protein
MKTFTLLTILSQTIAFSTFAGTAQIDNIKIASSVPSDQASRLIKDIQLLKGMTFANPDPNMLKLMGIADANGSTLASWMEDRVNFIVDNDFALNNTTVTDSKQSFNFPNPSETPTIETPAPAPSQSSGTSTAPSDVQVMMLNIGSAIYYAGKESNTLYSVQIPGVANELATSPRIGIIKIGAGMFSPLFSTDQGKDPSTYEDAMPYLALRLSVLIHESRHSDGNGKSLGFFHALCPSGIYANMNACDRNLNGPYQIQTTFLNSLGQSCTTCSAGDKVAIQAIAADSASRQIVSTADSATNDGATIQLLQSELDYCSIIANLPPGTIPAGTVDCSNTAAIQAQITALQTNPAVIPSTMWDATPEGTFSAN